MQGRYSRLSVRMATFVAFGIIVVMLLVSGIAIAIQQHQVDSAAETVLDSNATVGTLMRLDTELQRFAAANTTFLLTKRQQDRSTAEAALARVDELLEQLAADPGIAGSPEAERIAQGIPRLAGYQEQLASLALDDAANFPGLRYSNQRMNPITAGVLQHLGEIIRSADELSADGEARQYRIGAVARDARYVWATITSSLRGYLSFRSPGLLENIGLLQEQFDSHMAALATMERSYSFEQEMAMQELQALDGRFFDELESLAAVHGGDAWRTDAALLRAEVSPLLDTLSADIRTLADRQSGRLRQVSSSLVQALSRLGWGLLAVGLLVALVAVSAGHFTGRGILLLITSIREAVDQSVAGNLTYRMDERGRGEGPEIARLLNRLSVNLQGVVGRFHHAVVSIESAVDETMVVAGQSTRRAEELRGAVETMGQSVATTHAGFEAITSHSGEAAEKGQRARTTAEQAATLAEEARSAMDRLARDTVSVAASISELNNATESIGGMLDTIRSIAEQTNLLALNAAIEAARAGDQGRGFAVVADEVRTLAGRAADATGEIETLVTSLRDRATGAVRAIEDATAQANSNAGKVRQTAEALTEIQQLNADIDRINAAVSGTVESQRLVVADLSNAIGEVSESADETTAGAEKTAECAERLQTMAKELAHVIERFRT